MRRSLHGVALGVLAFLATSSVARALEVHFAQPHVGQGLFGPTEVVVATSGGQVAQVELYYNGARTGQRSSPPWKFVVDVGGENIERRFRAVATSTLGERVEVELVMPKIQVDEVLDLTLQQVYVTVTLAGADDPNGAPARDFARQVFQVYDDGARQRIVTFEGGDAPLAALLAIDSSLSMKGLPLRAALDGALAFAEGMLDLDEAKLLLFSDRVVHHTPFTSDPKTLLAGLTGAEADGGSAINDHLYLALQLLERRQGRRVVILLSDGIDVESLLTASQVAEVAARSQALIYWIRVGNEPFGMGHRSAWRKTAEHAAEITALAAMVDGSGGRRIDIQSYEQSAEAFTEILTELRQQYVIGYYPDKLRKDGSWHPLRVEVSHSDALIRTRGGYYDD